jgi:hypothetical protein
MKRLKDESGQALIITALCMTCLFGFAALATDVGIMLREKRLLQIAADSAAIAGALELNFGTANVTTAAKAASAQNGFTDGTGGATVTVNPPPLYGPHKGVNGYVEVIISQTQPSLFMNFFGISSMKPTVRAVAQNGASADGCVYILSPNANAAMNLQGSFLLNTPNCGIIVDSNASDALSFTGKAGDLFAGSVGVVGNGSGGGVSGSPKLPNPFTPVTGIAPASDPLVGILPALPDPTKLSCSAPTAASSSTGSAGTLSGNVVMSNATNIMCYSGTVNVTGANFPAGTFVFTGDVNVSGSLTSAQPPPPAKPGDPSPNPLNGTTIDINSGTLSTATGTTWGLYAPQAAATDYTNYNGIALMQPKTNSNTLTIQKGNASGTIDGIIYAPSAQLFLQDSGGDTSGGINLITDLVVGTLFDKTASLSITSYSQTTAGSPLTRVALVE